VQAIFLIGVLFYLHSFLGTHGEGKFRSMDNTKIGIKRETLTEKMKRSPDERHK
jgi:hypothetical protein